MMVVMMVFHNNNLFIDCKDENFIVCHNSLFLMKNEDFYHHN